jgi:hypothetical protein
MGSPAATRSATGFGALYDKAGKLVDETEQIRTGGPKGRRDFRFHIERQVLERFRTKGLLRRVRPSSSSPTPNGPCAGSAAQTSTGF